MNEAGKSLESFPSLLCRSQTPDKQDKPAYQIVTVKQQFSFYSSILS
jgi:hypothetical protein